MRISTGISKEEYSRVMEIWEASVRATHHFLSDEQIGYFKPLILNEFLDAVRLFGIYDDQENLWGFMGLSEDKIEMLFIHPDQFGKGLGRQLLHVAVYDYSIRKLDVNEQNPDAVGFYKHMGFTVHSRSETDALGKPYPILHMEFLH